VVQIYQQFAHNNLLANHRLLSAAQTLLNGEFEAASVGYFPSIKKTLNHIITVDWFYVDALEGGTLGTDAWQNPEPFDDPNALRKAQSEFMFRSDHQDRAADLVAAGLAEQDLQNF